MDRLADLARTTFDVIIIGGGIIGAGIARDAALRGLGVALVEQADFGGGTTAGSTRLIHGGLRYLELLDIPLVRMDLREREILLRIAPHLVHPLEFLLPFYDRRRLFRWRIRTGMRLYDALSYDRSLPGHRVLTAEAARGLEPALQPLGLQGAVTYFDAQAPMPERLCLENVLDAQANGACLRNYVRAVGASHVQGRVVALRVRDVLVPDGDEVEVRGRIVINATGAWLDRVEPRLTGRASARVRTTKGVHFAAPLATTRAIAVPSRVDGRLVFVIPWLGYSWIGTTDTDFDDDPTNAFATQDDVDYLIRSVQHYLPAISAESIYFSNAGVRALVRRPGRPSSVSRLHRVSDGDRSGQPGVISVLGGKLTGYRAIAEEVTNLVCRKLGVTRKCTTAERVLPGAERMRDGAAASLASRVTRAVREELTQRVADFLFRRTPIGFGPDQGMGVVEEVAILMARELGWSEERRLVEIAACRAIVTTSQRFRGGATTVIEVDNGQRGRLGRA
jgi:glycerol-3-phosphate dehydrogenase